jgi:thioredoxin reductase (NADPH)
MDNVIIIGSGPAGYTAAIYLARANLNPLVLEGTPSDTITPGGLLTTTKIVENFPGFPDGVDGYELTESFRNQALRFGARMKQETVISVIAVNDVFEVITNDQTYQARTVIVATGSTPKRLYIPGYDEFWHKGVSTCAVCDGGLPCFRNVPIGVLGGGDSAAEEALHLTHTASKVYLIHRRDTLRASKIMADRVLSNKKIVPIWNSEVVEIRGADHVTSLTIRNTVTGELSDLSVAGLFVAIGHTPNSECVQNLVQIDADGYIETDRHMSTNVPGLYAAGDVQDRYYRQAITAAGSGCISGLEVEKFILIKG